MQPKYTKVYFFSTIIKTENKVIKHKPKSHNTLTLLRLK